MTVRFYEIIETERVPFREGDERAARSASGYPTMCWWQAGAWQVWPKPEPGLEILYDLTRHPRGFIVEA